MVQNMVQEMVQNMVQEMVQNMVQEMVQKIVQSIFYPMPSYSVVKCLLLML